MREITCAALTVSVLLPGAVPTDAWGGPTVVVAPQQTFILANRQAVIVAEPFPVVQRPFFIPRGVVVPVAFVPYRAFHHRLGHVIVFIDPATAVVWPSGFWWWSGTAWAWAPQTIVW
jgi:hypothetical protein